jgi:hypothetical protein
VVTTPSVALVKTCYGVKVHTRKKLTASEKEKIRKFYQPQGEVSCLLMEFCETCTPYEFKEIE